MLAPAGEVDARFLEAIEATAPYASPSRAELEVAYLLVVRAMTVRQAAALRGVTPSTARTHWRRFADKVGLEPPLCRQELRELYWRL